MKFIAKILVLGAALAAATPFASATPISGTVGFAGQGTLTGGTTGSFSGSTTAGVLMPGTGTLAPFVFMTPATFNAFSNASTIPTGTTLFTSTASGITLTFTYSGTSTTSVDSTGNGILITGILHETGYDNTVGTLDISGNGTSAIFTAGVNAAPTPEPSSLLLLGTGLIGAAGVAFRKRSLVS